MFSLECFFGDVNGRDSLHDISWTNWISLVLHSQCSASVSAITLYILSPFSILSFRLEWMIRLSAEVENNMNSIERIVHYATEIEQEAPQEILDQKPPVSWPTQGQIVLKDVVLKYRPELQSVLKGLSMDVKAGEKVGIVGRYSIVF